MHTQDIMDLRERVLLVGVEVKSIADSKASRKNRYSISDSLEELARLADTAGLKVTQPMLA
jgi:50S ribosomal subunit-associated GTPase HflX